MNKFTLKLALKYLRGAQDKKSISTMVGISFIGILIGSFSLMLSLAIMNGFEAATYERLQSIHAQLIIRAFGSPINMQSLKPVGMNILQFVQPICEYQIDQQASLCPQLHESDVLHGV